MIATQDQRLRGIILLIITALLWSFGGLFIKLIDWNPIAIAGTRSGIAAVMILLYLRRPKFTWSKYQLWGAVAYSATVLLFVLANKLTTAANTIFLQYTSPIWIALFGGWFVGERLKGRDWLFVAQSLVGGSGPRTMNGSAIMPVSIFPSKTVSTGEPAFCFRRSSVNQPKEMPLTTAAILP